MPKKSKSEKEGSSEKVEFDVKDKNVQEYFSQIEDWALQEDDELQSFDEFLRMERYPVTKKRRTIYLIPIGDVTSITQPNKGILSLHNLVLFCKTYFCMECSILEGLGITQDEDGFYLVPSHDKSFLYPIRTVQSKDYPGVTRLHALDILRVLQELLPSDGFCIFGVTFSDLYEHFSKKDKEDTPILGRATGDRVGVISLLRFDPNLANTAPAKPQNKRKRSDNNNNNNSNNDNHATTVSNCSEDQLKKWLLRVIKTVAHELMHTMGLDHCVTMACVMNGCVAPDHVLESLTEAQKESVDPIFLCPLDLKKLHTAIGFDVVTRYTGMLKFFEEFGYEHEASWLKKRLKYLNQKS